MLCACGRIAQDCGRLCVDVYRCERIDQCEIGAQQGLRAYVRVIMPFLLASAFERKAPGMGLMTINKGNGCRLDSRVNFPYCHSVF